MLSNWDMQSKQLVHLRTRLPALPHGAESQEICSGHLVASPVSIPGPSL